MNFLRIYLFLTVTVAGIFTGISASKETSQEITPRRFSSPHERSVILGAPSHAYHLPAAEPVLPGHTLIRPAIGMLKSAVKFPHREQEDGSGVYGHFENIGIKFAGKNERVPYTGFRRSQSDGLLYPSGKLKRPKNPRPYTNVLRNNKDYYDGKYDKTSLGKIIAVQNIEATDLLDFLRIIESFRRDDFNSIEENQTKPPHHSKDLKYVPGKNIIFGLAPTNFDSEEREVHNKTVLFWNTKNLFNHVKYNPDAPDIEEFLPTDSSDTSRNWWFYHQSDFEEFDE